MNAFFGVAPSSLRRAKPMLGTIVEISVQASDLQLAQRAVAAAFAEVAVVHRLMSFHEAQSDVQRLNCATEGALIIVDARTAEVLSCAERLTAESGGDFHCAVADVLVGLGRLPKSPCASLGSSLEIDSGQCVVRRGRAAIDLGGIAKGYAVDRAIELLMRMGMDSALVNAGGDLRHCGSGSVMIHLRDPVDPADIATSIALDNQALASSATSGLTGTSSLINPRSMQLLPRGAGVSITAPNCMTADALTKVVLVSGDTDHAVLRRHGAQVVLYRAARALA
jgi:thiamine biosynthesis lipoprotein